MSLIEVTNLSKSFGETTALENISFEVEEGEFVSILGPSGSGKTTLLKIIAGFTDPDEGDIIFDGNSLINVPPENRELSLVFQRLALFPHMNVYENVAFGLKMKTDLSEDKIEEKVAEILEMVNLSEYENRNITSLSGGEQQRIALARALVVEPSLILFDEPLSDLDRQLRETMRREIKQIHEKLDVTSIYVTHNQREALTLSDRIMVLNEGRREEYDSPSEIYNNPSSKFLADFVGESNFLSCSIHHEDGKSVFEADGIRLQLEESIKADGEGLIYIRPEHIQIGSNFTGERVFDADVNDAVHLGSVTEYSVTLGDISLRINELGQPRYEPGEDVKIKIDEFGLLT